MQLPIASNDIVRAYARKLITSHKLDIVKMLGLYALAAITGLIPAWVIGKIINLATTNTLHTDNITRLVIFLLVSSLSFALLTFLARTQSYKLGETIFATLREEFLASVLALPLIDVERAGTGDLLSRTTNDVEALSRTVRFALPEWLSLIHI